MKGDNDLTKLARWIIPGWIALLAFISFVVIDMLMAEPNKSPLFSLDEFLSSVNGFSVILTAVVLAASGVPLGFTIYQIYFFIRWNSPFSRDGLLPPVVPGRMSELVQILDDITNEELTQNEEWRERLTADPFYKRDHGYRSR